MPSIQDAAFADLNVFLSRRVAEILLSYDPDAYRLLNVTARGDVVYLSGLAVGYDTRDAAVELVRTVAGVADVVDRVLVRPHPPRPTALTVPVTQPLPTGSWQSVTPLALFGLLFALVAWQWTSILRAEQASHEPPAFRTAQVADGATVR
jgi:hypothetical protein